MSWRSGERAKRAPDGDTKGCCDKLRELDEAFKRWRVAAYAAGLDVDRHRRELNDASGE